MSQECLQIGSEPTIQQNLPYFTKHYYQILSAQGTEQPVAHAHVYNTEETCTVPSLALRSITNTHRLPSVLHWIWPSVRLKCSSIAKKTNNIAGTFNLIV